MVGHSKIEAVEQAAWKYDPRYLLVQRILKTSDFIRSPQLSKFLLYICTATFEGREQILSEQHIGVAVFGREPRYDSAADTIVRSHALRLRRRLEQYFQRSGRNEPLHLAIPRGSYVPVFLTAAERRSGSDGAATGASPKDEPGFADSGNILQHKLSSELAFLSETPANADPLSDRTRRSDSTNLRVAEHRSAVLWRYRLAVACLTLFCIGLAVALGMQLHKYIPVKRHHPLWDRLFTDDQPTEIVLGDSGLVLFHAVTRRYVSLQDYLSGDVSAQIPFVENVQPQFAQFLRQRRYTSVVDATALARLVRLPEAIPERTLVRYARDMHLSDFKSGNVLVIGAQEAVPWVELFETHMDFPFSIENPDRHASFLNRHPQSGERAEYDSDTPGTSAKLYSVIAFLPNLSGTGNVLIMEGLSMAGTEAAVDLACNDDRMIPLLNKIRKPNGSLPHFEMLLESDTLGESAGPARLVSIHLHD